MISELKAVKKAPKLRFPGFSGEWEEKKLGDLLKIGSGRDYKHLGEGDIPVYGTGGLMLKVDEFLYDGKSIGIGRKGTIDKPQWLEGKFWTVDTLFYTKDYKDSVPEFLFAIFQKINWQAHNEASGVPSLSKTTIEKIKVVVPGKKEQKRIAGFLGDVDDRISALQKKVELMKKYKKGMMRKIFSQQIRFKDKDSKDYPAWQEKKFSECLESLATKSYQIKSSSFKTNGKYPVVDQGLDKIAGYTDEDTKVFKNTPVIIFGDHTTFLKYIDFEFVVGADGTKVLRSKSNNLKYLYYALENNKVEPEGYKRHFSILKTYLLPLPSTEEQEKIADFLTSIDAKIDLTERKLEQTKLFKKALLQKMFV